MQQGGHGLDAGWSEHRDAVFASLVNVMLVQPDVDLRRLAQLTDLDEGVVSRGVGELTELGIVRPDTGDGEGWVLVHPRTAMHDVVADGERRLAVQLESVTRTRQLVESVSSVFGHSGHFPSGAGLTMLPRREDVVARLSDLVTNVQDEVCSFVTQTPSVDGGEEGRRLDRELLDRGVALRSLCLEVFYNDASVARHLLKSSATGVKIRTRPTLPGRMVIIDRSVAVVARDPEDSTRGAVLVEQRGLVRLLHELFEMHWDQGTPIAAAPPKVLAGAASPMELAILDLLALGYKDDAIARSTGQSTRTVRRVIAGLSITLKARSRFDLALRAAARGWVNSPFD